MQEREACSRDDAGVDGDGEFLFGDAAGAQVYGGIGVIWEVVIAWVLGVSFTSSVAEQTVFCGHARWKLVHVAATGD